MSGMAERTRAWIESKHVLWGVFVASLAETTVVPIPIEVVLITVMLANRRRLWWIASAALAGCLAGAGLGYLAGYGAFETVGEPVLRWLGLAERFEEYRIRLEEDGFWYVVAIAITPAPFHIAYLGAGVVRMPFLTFFAAAAIGRGVRYFGLAVLVRILGDAAGDWLERHTYRVAIWATVLFIVVFVAVQLIG